MERFGKYPRPHISVLIYDCDNNRDFGFSSAVCQSVNYFSYGNLKKLYTYGPAHDKINKIDVCTAKTQISLGIRPV